jgi:hypothetical protein
MGGLDWINLTQDRTSGELCEHANEPSGSINFWDERLAASQGLGSMELLG